MNKKFHIEFKEKFLAPWSWSFIGYLIIFVFLGGLGVFFTIHDVYKDNWKDSYKIAESIATFFVAIIATSCIDLNLSKNIVNRLSFIIYSFLFYALTAFLLWCTYDFKSNLAFWPAF